MRRVVAGIFAAMALGAPGVAHAQGADQTCLLALTRFDAATVNVLYPDDSAQYWSGAYAAVPGTRLRVDGRFPHARYMSFNVYDPALRPVDAIADFEIEPADPGSANPYRTGADRTAATRDYSVFVEFGPRPDQPAANTIYTDAQTTGLLTYRIYVPDSGRDEFGDAGLPTVTVQSADGEKADPSACAQASKPTVEEVNAFLRDSNGVKETENTGWPGRDPVVWRKFTNVFGALADNVSDSEVSQELFEAQRGLELHERGGNGGFLSNVHNAYVSGFTNRAFSRVLITRLRPPSFPDTRDGAKTMPGGQVRYWSLCGNDPPTQRYVACLNDDRVVVGRDGLATFVMTTAGERPENAREECGINWLPWGNGARNLLIYRHMLPEPGFAQSIQAATFEREAETMGDHLPVSSYTDQEGVAALGCPGAAAKDPVAAAKRRFKRLQRKHLSAQRRALRRAKRRVR